MIHLCRLWIFNWLE